jgi:hypothetical protein
MMLGQNDPLELVGRLRGLTPWGVRLGVGSFLTLEFGAPEAETSGPTKHGVMHLWLYLCSWRIQTRGKPILGSEDERQRIEAVLKELEFGEAEKIELVGPSLDLAIQFRSGTKLLTFSTSSTHEQEEWKLYMPDGNCFTVFGDGSYENTPIDTPRP